MQRAGDVLTMPEVPKPKGIKEKLMLARQAFKPLHKDGKNPHFGNKYATLNAFIEATREALDSQRLIVEDHTDYHDGQVILVTTISDVDSDQKRESRYPVIPAKPTDPQALGGALTYAKRYQYGMILGLVAEDEDDDGETAAGRGKSKPEQKPKAEQKPGCLNPEQTDALWKYARKLFPKDARERLKALLEKHGVERTADLPVYPAGNDDASGWGGYANELDVMLSEAK